MIHVPRNVNKIKAHVAAKIISSCAIVMIGASHHVAAQEAPSVTPQSKINLIEILSGDARHSQLSAERSIDNNAENVWTFTEDGKLRVSGKGLGYLRTTTAYQNYHLVLEYRWLERTFGDRADRARDGGLLLHGVGGDATVADSWPSCIEAQLLEGGTGNIFVLAGKDSTGAPLPTKATFKIKDDSKGSPTWSPEGEARTYPQEGKAVSRINWKDRSADWTDQRGYRGSNDIENPLGEWNRLEVICEADTVRIMLNGELVNEATAVHPQQGFIGIKSEFASYEVRRWELYPTGGFQEKWVAEVGSTDMGYDASGASILPRRFPLSPEESRKLWQVDEAYEVQLVASEPLITDPVDLVWDEKGRLFVAEMSDYPLPVGDGGPHLSRIRLLEDTNGDGVMDVAKTWAADLDHVQGMQAYDGGLLITTRTAIMHLKDNDGDGVAEVRKNLFHSNEPTHNQLQVSSPRYGIDNLIYFSNGLDGKEIYPDETPDQIVKFPRLNLTWNPRSGAMSPATGIGQFGGSLDKYGRHFYASNRNPIMFSVMPYAMVQRTPLAAVGVGHEDLLPPGAPVRPLTLSHTTSSAHAGTYTSACGISIYEGDLMPDLSGNAFVCDPTGQLVTRNRLTPHGSTLVGEKLGETREFLVSADEWSRPVQTRTGPDGALYVCDMYRRFIDHARFFPEEFVASHYMRAGFDQGRIWRVVPKGSSPRQVEALPEKPTDLVALLTHPNAWQRTEAQRLLVEKQDKSVVPALETLLADTTNPLAAAHALGTLEGLDQLTDAHLSSILTAKDPGLLEVALLATSRRPNGTFEGFDASPLLSHPSNRVRFLAIGLFPSFTVEAKALAAQISHSPEDKWLRKAILSSHPGASAAILNHLLADTSVTTGESPAASEALTDLARVVATQGDLPRLASVIENLTGSPSWWHYAVLAGLSDGLRASPLKTKTLTALADQHAEALGKGANALKALIDQAAKIAVDRNQPEPARLATLPLVAQLPWESKAEIVSNLIAPVESPAIQEAACRLLARDNRAQVADFFFERWNTLGPVPLREALSLITANPQTGLELMKRMKAGEISPALMPPMPRWSYSRSNNPEIQAMAKELFGQSDSDRAQVIKAYESAMAELKGNAENGALVYQKAACFTCHQVRGQGIDVGPPLDDVKIKPNAGLLADILDPNRAIEDRWVSRVVETSDGRVLSGLVHSEDSATVVLRLPGGLTESVPRSEIKTISSTGLSLMPVGLEAAITHQEMADLIAYLKGQE